MAEINVPPMHVPEGEFTTIERRVGVVTPTLDSFPPITQRIGQTKDPFAPVDGDNILRVTYQGNEVCNLACDGCYIGDWLAPDGEHRAQNSNRLVDPQQFESHLDALPGLGEFYYIGAEAAAAPSHSADLLDRARKRGIALMGITNGANSQTNTDRTFGEFLDDGSMHKLVVSLDSIVPDINDRLRGQKGATAKTLDTIARFTDRGHLVKVQATVWPENYPYVLESTQRLFDEYDVKGFGYHYGSVEPFKDPAVAKNKYVNPVAWRSLAEQLLRFRDDNQDQLDVFYFPFTYYTREEMRKYIIGDDALSESYFELEKLGQKEKLPFVSCLQTDAQQVYVFANDGPEDVGQISLCNIDTVASDQTYATFDPTLGSFVPNPPGSNQMEHMLQSTNFCPAMKEATGGLHETDKYEIDGIELFHACRYPGVNQVPQDPEERNLFNDDLYSKWVNTYVRAGRLAIVSDLL